VCKTDWRQQGRIRGAKRRWIVLTTEKMFCCKSAEATEVPERELLLSPSNTTLFYGAMSSSSPASFPCSLSALFASDTESEPAPVPEPHCDEPAALPADESTRLLTASMPSPTLSSGEAAPDLVTLAASESLDLENPRSSSPPPVRPSSPSHLSLSSSSLFRIRRGRSSPPRDLASSSPPGSTSSLSTSTSTSKQKKSATHFVLSFRRTKFSRRAVALQEHSSMSLHFSATTESECIEWVKAISDVLEAQTSADWRVFCLEHGLRLPRGMETE